MLAAPPPQPVRCAWIRRPQLWVVCSLMRPCKGHGADVELATGDAGELIDTVSHEALGSMFDGAGGQDALPDLGKQI